MKKDLHERFRKMSSGLACWLGSVQAFVWSILLVVVWAAFGPFFSWSEGHQLIINSVTTVITFWMVFVIQNTQNCNDKEVQLKLAEIIRSLGKARNSFIRLEELSDAELKKIEADIKKASQRRGQNSVNNSRKEN